MSTNPDVDAYVARSDRWPEEISALRPILTGGGLTEEIKWAKPCYSHDRGNILILQEMKNILAIMFFKGALLTDPDGVLEDQGPNSRSARRICITSVGDVTRLADTIATYVAEAIEVENSGRQVAPAPELVLVEELQTRLDADPALRAAFEGLTPGRQREYHLHISSAKQASTRSSRMDACTPKILAGKGFRDR
ncbi:MAG TPA: YdeI/OmpD-associated family protein [Ilumatobacteraceae bacterium]|nr:YdeI/OmpD-associated family protein [Ilumatobacteraceae bacterium]